MYVRGLFLFSEENDGNGTARLHPARYCSVASPGIISCAAYSPRAHPGPPSPMDSEILRKH